MVRSIVRNCDWNLHIPSGSSTVHVISAGNCFRKTTSELEAWNGYLRTAVRVLSCSLISAIARLFPPCLFLYAGVFVRVDDCLSFVESVRIACTVDRLQLPLLPRCFRSGRPNTLFSVSPEVNRWIWLANNSFWIDGLVFVPSFPQTIVFLSLFSCRPWICGVAFRNFLLREFLLDLEDNHCDDDSVRSDTIANLIVLENVFDLKLSKGYWLLTAHRDRSVSAIGFLFPRPSPHFQLSFTMIVDLGGTDFAGPMECPVDPGSNSATYKMLGFLLVLQLSPKSWGTLVLCLALRGHPGVGKVYAVLTPLQAATGTMTVSEREETTTGNQQLLYLIINSIINVH